MTAVVLTALLLAGPDPEPATPPKGPPPVMAYLKADGGRVARFVNEQVMVQVVEKVKEVVGGKEIFKDVVRTKAVPVSRMMLFPADGAAYSTAGGKKLDDAEGRKRLAAGVMAALSSDGKPVDKAYLKAMKPDTLVVVPGRLPADVEKRN